MIVASEARFLGNLSGPKAIADEVGPILEHVAISEGLTMYDIVNENRAYLAKTEPSFEYFTLADAKRARNWVSQSAQAGNIFDYWILDNGKPVGDIELDLTPPGGKPELAYWLIEKAQGKGLATRAARTIMEYGFTLPHIEAVTMWIGLENTASQQVAKRIGATIIGQGLREVQDELVTHDIWEVSRDA